MSAPMTVSEELARLALGDVAIDPALQAVARWAVTEALVAVRDARGSWPKTAAAVLVGGTGVGAASPPQLAFLVGCLVAQRATPWGGGRPVDLAAVVVPAALAAAAVTETAGEREVVDAVALGMEATARVALGLGLSFYRRGWDLTCIAGRIGGAIAAGRVLGCDVVALQHAVGIAATEAAGLRRAARGELGSVQVAKAGWDALEAALLGRRGFTAAAASLEGRRGLGQLAGDGFATGVALQGLGERWVALEHLAFAWMGRDAPGFQAGLAAGAHGGETVEICRAPEPAAPARLGEEALSWSVSCGLHDAGHVEHVASGELVTVRSDESVTPGALVLVGVGPRQHFSPQLDPSALAAALPESGAAAGEASVWQALESLRASYA